MPDIRIESKIELRVELDHLTPLQGSLKELSVEAYQKLKKSILTHGFKFPIFVWRENKEIQSRIMGGKPLIATTNWILDGHGRRLVLLKLREEGYTVPALPCVEIPGDSLESAKRDVLLISSQYQHMTGDGLYEFMSDAGITVDELDAYDLPHIDMEEFRQEFFEDPEEENEGQCGEDEVPDKPAEARVRPGDVWTMGNHRLLCGDSTIGADVDKLMNGREANMVFTDPPYNVNYEGTDGQKIQNDNMSDEQFRAFCGAFFANYFSSMEEGAPIYVFHADTEGGIFRETFREAGFHLSSCIVWNKSSLIMGRSDYHWKHEPCLYGWKPGKAHPWYSDRKQTSVFDHAKGSGEDNKMHPTCKPVSLVEYFMGNSSKSGDLILDLFLGSGSTLIAAHKNNRTCYGMELDPIYCAVILSRWAKFSGQDPVRESDGVKWSTINMV